MTVEHSRRLTGFCAGAVLLIATAGCRAPSPDVALSDAHASATADASDAAPLVAGTMAALAGLLLVVAWNMSEARHFLHVARVAPRSDAIVLLTCFVLTVVFDMVLAVSVGVVLAAMLFMKRMAELTHGRLLDDGDPAGPGTPGSSCWRSAACRRSTRPAWSRSRARSNACTATANSC